MIRINMLPATLDNLDFPFSDEPIRADILNKMLTSQSVFDYTTKDELLFEINLRAETIASALALYNSRMGFAVFRYAKANPKYWNITSDGGFELIKGVNSGDAIDDIFKNGYLYATECATAMMIVYYKALLNVIGNDKFSDNFTDITLMNWAYIDRRLREVGMLRKYSDYLPGDRLYFKNPDVNPETPQWQGENVIDMSEGMYYGHGIGIHNAEFIISTLNSVRRANAKRPAFLMDSAGRPDYKSLYHLFYS